MLDESGALMPALMTRGAALPTPETLRTWTAESQTAFWMFRFGYWEKQVLKNCFKGCKHSTPELWPGGDLRDIRKRLVTAGK
jgi:hypothetical protein